MQQICNIQTGTHVDADSLRKTKKGLFKQKLSLLRRRKRRRNSIGSVSSASESFRTITPLNSDKEDVADIGKEPFDWGRSQSPTTTSTSYKKGRRFASQLILLLYFYFHFFLFPYFN